MTFGLATRITLVLVVILAAGVTVTTVLSAHMFERTLSDFLTSRFEFELNDVRQRIEIQMDLGIALAEIQSVSEELQEYLHAASRKQGWWAGPVADQIDFVVDDLGIPPNELVGVDPFLDKILAASQCGHRISDHAG